MAELKPCPFCGGQAYTEQWSMAPFERKHILDVNDGYFYAVVCVDCDASTGSKLSEEDAIKSWNGREGEDGP